MIRSPNINPAGVIGRLGAERRTRLVVGLAPALLVVIVLEILLALDADWFAGPVGYVGVLAVPLVGGVFPVLLVAAARRKGEYVPGRVIRLLGHPVTVVIVGAIFLTGVFLHGLVIWQEPVARVAALVVGVLTVALILRLIATGRFQRRSIIELRLDEPGRGVINVTSAGRAVLAGQPFALAGHGRQTQPVSVDLAGGPVRDLRVWSHQVSADGWSSSIPATITIEGGVVGGESAAKVPTTGSPDSILFALDGRPVRVVVQLDPPDPRG